MGSKQKTRQWKRKGRVKRLGTGVGASRTRNAQKGARCRRCRKQKGLTHDWALDLEPLALPPDLPPVILRDLGFGGKGGKISELGAEDGLGACGGRGVSRRWIACWWWGATLAYKDGAGVSRSARSTGRLARPELWQSGRARLRKITLSSLSRPTTRRRARPSIAALIQQEAASTGPPGAAGSQHAARSP